MRKILGPDGKVAPSIKTARAAICFSHDGEEWYIIAPGNVPEWLQEPEVMGDLMSGSILSKGDSGPYYCAEIVH